MLLRHRTLALLSMSNSSNSNHNGQIQYMLQFPWRTVFCISQKTRNFQADSVVPNEFVLFRLVNFIHLTKPFAGFQLLPPIQLCIQQWLLKVLQPCLVTFATVHQGQQINEQVCIPVGCVPTTFYRTGVGGVGVGVSVGGLYPGRSLCRGLCLRGLCLGVSVQWVSVQGGLCLGGLCQGDPSTETSLEGTWDQRQKPQKEHGTRDRTTPRRNIGPAARQEVTSYRDPLLSFYLWREWQTDRCKIITLPQFAGGNKLLKL